MNILSHSTIKNLSICTLVGIFAMTVPLAQAQSIGKQIPSEFTGGVQIETHSPRYNAAYIELADMLDGKTTLSIKRAVFLAEWAYLDGELDYDKYCAEIDSTAKALKLFIAANNLGKYKSGGNFALFEYFSRPYSMNGYKPFTYDFEDFAGSDDFTKLFVTKVMRTHSGQCRSLPMYYKVLSEAIGAEAHITFAPQHLFIRHRDEQDPNKWVNVELTTLSLGREMFYIESFGITDEAIRNKVYMYPLTDKETVALMRAFEVVNPHPLLRYLTHLWQIIKEIGVQNPATVTAIEPLDKPILRRTFWLRILHLDAIPRAPITDSADINLARYRPLFAPVCQRAM